MSVRTARVSDMRGLTCGAGRSSRINDGTWRRNAFASAQAPHREKLAGDLPSVGGLHQLQDLPADAAVIATTGHEVQRGLGERAVLVDAHMAEALPETLPAAEDRVTEIGVAAEGGRGHVRAGSGWRYGGEGNVVIEQEGAKAGLVARRDAFGVAVQHGGDGRVVVRRGNVAPGVGGWCSGVSLHGGDRKGENEEFHRRVAR